MGREEAQRVTAHAVPETAPAPVLCSADEEDRDAQWLSGQKRPYFAQDFGYRQEFMAAKRYVDDVVMASWWLCCRCLGEQVADTYGSVVFELQDPPHPSKGRSAA